MSYFFIGTGDYGQLGHEDATLNRCLVPTAAKALSGMRVYGVAAGEHHSVFLSVPPDQRNGMARPTWTG